MTDDWKTLRVPADDYAAAKEQKEANDRTWGEQLRHSEPAVEESDIQEDINELKDMIDAIAFDGGILDGEAEQLMGRLDDLEARLPRKVAEELEGNDNVY